MPSLLLLLLLHFIIIQFFFLLLFFSIFVAFFLFGSSMRFFDEHSNVDKNKIIYNFNASNMRYKSHTVNISFLCRLISVAHTMPWARACKNPRNAQNFDFNVPKYEQLFVQMHGNCKETRTRDRAMIQTSRACICFSY